ncbi:unnamed protein product [Lymnaea stagnalis]|uniref:AIG1-type G domain-containing protein n=1 Tax=Lymnaea stagnalis TaxID=6523 RepID=A0AAV2I0E6_LYMST
MASVRPFVNLVLLGKTGHGKSSTGNSIIGREEAFKRSDATVSETKMCTLQCFMRGDTLVRVVDTPGLLDTQEPTESTLSEIGQAMSLCPGGFSAIIFVMRYGTRFTEEEKQVFITLKQYFGENILRDFGVIVMTQGDSFSNNYCESFTFQEWLNDQKEKDGESPFVQLLNECNNRCVLFYNRGPMFKQLKEESVKEMFDLIRGEIPKPYTSEHFQHAKTARETLIKNLRAPALCAEIQEKLSLLVDQLNRDMRNNVVSYDAMTSNIKEIEWELVKLNDKSKEFQSFKRQIDGLTENIKQMRETEDEEKQRQQQEQMIKDLETMKNFPGFVQFSAAKFVLGFTKVFTTVCNYATVGQFQDTFEIINDRIEKYLNEVNENYEKYMDILNRATLENLPEIMYHLF